jgi:hypothetical protein
MKISSNQGQFISSERASRLQSEYLDTPTKDSLFCWAPCNLWGAMLQYVNHPHNKFYQREMCN